MRRLTGLLITMTCVCAVSVGCGGGDDTGGSDDSSSSTTTKVIDVTISGDSVTPNGDRVEVAVGQPIELDVTADTAGEIHVHSTPEQELEYDAGNTKITMTPIRSPGLVEVESHALDKTIVQLEAK